jgi:hypothetical protein
MSSWDEPQPQYEYYPSQPYLHTLDVHDESIREAEHPQSMVTRLSYTPRPSPDGSRQTYNSGLYGPRPQPPSNPEPIQGLPTPTMVPPAMSDLEEADDEYMEVEPMAVTGGPLYSSEFDDEPREGRRRFVGGFIRGLKKIPKAMRRGFSPQKRELPTPPGLAYYEPPYRSPYIDEIEPEESEAAPPYDAPSDHVEGDLGYTDGVDMPTEFRETPSPSLTPSHTVHAPRSESQLTYQSRTDPLSRHVSHHGSLHHVQRPSPPRTVRNPDPSSPTDDSGTVNPNSPRYEQPPLESEQDSMYRTPHLSPARRPMVTVQSPTDSPVYFEPPPADDYAGMDVGSLTDHSPEPSVPTQLSRIGRFFRDLKNLPWISPNVTVDFDPTDAERARYGHGQGPGKSWYTGHLQDLDLLAGDSNTRGLTSPSGHPFGPAPGSSATLAPPFQGSGSASNSSEGASTHLPTAPTLPPYPYPVQTLALPHQPLYYYPFTAMSPPHQQQQQYYQQPIPHAPEQVSLQSSGNSDVPKQPFLYVVAMPPGYGPGPVDHSRPMQPTQPTQPTFPVPYAPPV